MSNSHGPSTSGEKPYDGELAFGFLIKALAGTLVAIALACGFVYWLYGVYLGQQERADPPAPVLIEASQPIAVPGPTLLQLPELELERVRTKASKQLSEYAWVDEASGVARIPIDRAIVIVAEQAARAEASAANEPTVLDDTDPETTEAGDDDASSPLDGTTE